MKREYHDAKIDVIRFEHERIMKSLYKTVNELGPGDIGGGEDAGGDISGMWDE